MIPNHLLRTTTGRNALLTLPRLVLEETHSTMPTTTVQQLNERVKNLEDSLEKDTNTLRGEVKALDEKLNTQTSAERTVTWSQFRWLLGGIASGMLVIISATLGAAGFFYTQLLPEKIETGISNSMSLSNNFNGLNKRLEVFDGGLKEIRNEIAELRFNIRGLADSKFIAAALKEAVSGDQATLSKRLPDVKRLTRQITSLKIPLPDKDYREISKPLMNHYDTSKPPFQHQLWEALVDLANARSSTDTIVHPLSEAEIADARARGTYIENIDVDLSEKTNWEGIIFKNCEIRISKPENDLTLTKVRFTECSFQLQSENGPMQKLLGAVLENNGPQISKPIAHYWVQPPVYRAGKQQ